MEFIQNTILNKYKDKGLSGLSNVGNTCFINSSMQILSHTYELNELLNDETFKERIKTNNDSSCLMKEWDELRLLMWSQNCIITPNKFVRTVQAVSIKKGYELFSGFNQNDSTEFLGFIIDCFHTSVSREVDMTIDGEVQNETDKMAVKCYERIKSMYEKDYSEIWKMFYGTQVSTLTKLDHINKRAKVKPISMIPEPFFMLSLPIPSDKRNPTLMDCFDLYTMDEILDGENAYTNEEGGKSEKIAVKKRFMFWNFPDILVIDLKRYNVHNRKNQIAVHFPLESLDLSKYVIGYSRSYVYDLYAISNHFGGVQGGHYTSFIRNANGKWYHFNDAQVQEISEKKVITPFAYCLFYRIRKE